MRPFVQITVVLKLVPLQVDYRTSQRWHVVLIGKDVQQDAIMTIFLNEPFHELVILL